MRLIRIASIAAAVTTLSIGAAFAHVGDHSHMTMTQWLQHSLGDLQQVTALVALGALLSLAGSAAVAKLRGPSKR